MRNRLLVFLFLFIFSTGLIAQSTGLTTSNSFNNLTIPDWDDYDWDDYLWTGDSRPFIELNYGMGNLKQFDYQNLFSKIGIVELKLGYTVVDSWDGDILDFQDNYFFGSRISDRVLSSPENKGKITTDSWRFGFADRAGYGYKVGSFSFLPYYGSGFMWTNVKVTDPVYRDILDNEEDAYEDPAANMLNRYDATFRFGQINEAGLNIQMGSMFNLGACYEFSVVYPRHLFGKQILSYAIEMAGQGAINIFINEIMDNSSAAGPVVNFLLKNGFSYGMFVLRKENMNWPFTTEIPLTYETFKVNVGFTF